MMRPKLSRRSHPTPRSGDTLVVQNNHYDVVIMGGGIAGNLQARHLVRTIPGIRVAMVDPRSDKKIETIHKIGESTVEIAAIFMSKDLGLVDYLIENHPPKCGLAFHWAKDTAKTDTVDDYFSVWPPRFPKVLTFQIHRGRFERDLRKMNIDDGVTFIHGKVRDFEVHETASNTVDVKVVGGDDLDLRADHTAQRERHCGPTASWNKCWRCFGCAL